MVAVGLVGSNIHYNRTHYTAEFYQISSRKLTHSIRLVFLSDVHLHEYGEDNCELVEDIQNLSPDLILLGGDLTIDTVSSYDNMLSLCRQLTQIAPVFGVLGNHEDTMVYLQNDQELVSKFEETGIHLLRNEEGRYDLYGNTISILGIEGQPQDFDKYNTKNFMEQMDQENDYDFRMCIAHMPTYFPDILENYNFELGLAGHTHGGIVRLPKIGPLYTAEEGFLPTYAGGTYTLTNRATLIVSRGLGDSSNWPRINNVPELSVIDVD